MKRLILSTLLSISILSSSGVASGASDNNASFQSQSLENDFKIGYEYRTVENTLHSGSVRLELDSYYIPQEIEDLHINIKFVLIEKDEKSDINSTVTPKGEKQSLTVSMNIIKPLTRVEDIKFLTKTYDGFFAFIGEYALTKSKDMKKRGRQEYYVGFRSAVNKDIYYDVMYGKTETLGKNRVKFRGQTSIKDSAWSIGGEYLLSTKNRKNSEDFMKIYLSKEFNFGEMF